jgi:hypothetical protein
VGHPFADENADCDPERGECPVNRAEEPGRHFIDSSYDRNPDADPRRRKERPPTTHNQAENQASNDEDQVRQDESLIGPPPPVRKRYGFVPGPRQLRPGGERRYRGYEPP